MPPGAFQRVSKIQVGQLANCWTDAKPCGSDWALMWYSAVPAEELLSFMRTSSFGGQGTPSKPDSSCGGSELDAGLLAAPGVLTAAAPGLAAKHLGAGRGEPHMKA
eukprot:7529886-Alexandrium_andersonii.AAC.1